MKKYAAVFAILAITTGCGYLGTARPIDPAEFGREPGWLAVSNLQFQEQKADNDCGAASAAMVLTHWGLASTPEDVLARCPATEEGMRAGDLRDFIKKRGLQGFLIHGTLDDLKTELAARRPVIVGLIKPYLTGDWTHYEVVVAIHPEQRRVATFDPRKGPRENTFEGFLKEWEPAKSLAIVVTGREGKPSSQSPVPSFQRTAHELGTGYWKLEAVLSSDFRTGNGTLAHKSLTPLKAAPHPGGPNLFPSGCRRPLIRRHAREPGVLYRNEDREGFQEVRVVRLDA